MMKNLITYLSKNDIQFKEIDDRFIEINSETYYLLLPDEAGVIFDEDFCLIVDEHQDCDKYIYQFGDKWFWEDNEGILEPKMNVLKYVGEINSDIQTKSFLGIRGAYEILNGSRMYVDWVKKGKFLGCTTLGICEKNTLAGVLKFQLECQKFGVKPVIGATYTVFRAKQDLRYDVKVYVKDTQGWDNLLKINKFVNVINKKFIDEDDLFGLLEGLFLIIDPKSLMFSDISKNLRRKIDYYQLDPVEYLNDEIDRVYLDNLKQYVRSSIPPVSIADAFYLDPEEAHIKPILNSISGVREYTSNDQFFKNKALYFDQLDKLFSVETDELFEFFNEACLNEQKISEACTFVVPLGKRYLPKYKMTDEEKSKFSTNEDLFWSLIEEGLRIKGITADKYIKRVDEEFSVIEKGDVIDYFLILWDIINYARRNDVLVGIGRGSSGGSLVAYLLGITQMDPLEFDLLFSRFINEGRIVKSLPDIDSDFSGSKRELIKSYIELRYGSEQVCSVGTYTAFQVKAAIKDLCKQVGVDFGEVNQITTLLPNIKNLNEFFKRCVGDKRLKSFVKKNQEVIENIGLILHQPKAKSIHACAMLIFPDDKTMFEWIPISNIDGQMVSEWEGVELEQAGFLKEDILGIKQLDKFEDILALIKESKGIDIDIYNIPLDNQKVYQYFSKGWNEDTFHFGSRGLTGYCRELKPDNIEDLIAGISLYRPGAMENNFHNEYVLRKSGERDVEFFVGSEKILNKTYGVFVYQEQIMKLCEVLGGLTSVEADDVRKAMVKKKYDELTKYKDRFIPYYVKTFGVSIQYATDVWETIDKASTYLFNRSHATAYAITGYISQWLKVKYPIEYWSVALKYSEEEDHANYISEISQTGDIQVKSVDINKSTDSVFIDFKDNTIYWSLTSVKQCADKSATQIIEDRKLNGLYFSFEEFCDRVKFKGSKVTKQVVENLIQCGAFDSIEGIRNSSDRLRLIHYYRKINKVKVDNEKDLFELNKVNTSENWWFMLQQKRLSGISFLNYKEILEPYFKGVEYISSEAFQSENLKHNRFVKIGGYIVSITENNSKKGKLFRIGIESNYKFINIVVWNEQYKDFLASKIQEKEKCLLLISGQMHYDRYKSENVLQTTSETEFVILE